MTFTLPALAALLAFFWFSGSFATAALFFWLRGSGNPRCEDRESLTPKPAVLNFGGGSKSRPMTDEERRSADEFFWEQCGPLIKAQAEEAKRRNPTFPC